MRRSLVAGATAIGMLVAAALIPVTGAVASERPAAPLQCDGTAAGEAAAVELAAACDGDVQVLGGSGSENTALYAEPDGGMRLESYVEDPVVWRNAASRVVLSADGPSEYGGDGNRWVGYCDPAEYAEGCAEAGVQRAVWQVDGFDILAELEPEDITSAEFIVNGDTAWLDDVGCTANRLEIYDVPLISADTDWSSTPAWTDDKRVGGMSTYWHACEESPAYTGYFGIGVTQLAVNAARDDRTSVAVGVRAADETCMTCGWNLLSQHAILRVNFNRAPLAPSGLEIGFLRSKVPCTGEPALRTTTPYIGAAIVDPDPSGQTNWVETATYRIAHAATPDTTLWEGTSTVVPAISWHQAAVPSGVLEDRGRYLVTVFGTDNHGLTGPGATCIFTVDSTAPAKPEITPLVGGQAVYLTGVARGGWRVPGAFLLTSASDDVSRYEYGLNSDHLSTSVPAVGNTILEIAPSPVGKSYLSVAAFDKAGNRSEITTYEFDVADQYTHGAETPPAITVTGPTSYTVGDDVPTALVTLSADAMTPYGAVTVTSGSAVVGSAVFDGRTEEVKLDVSGLGTGVKELTFTYRAYPEAPAWTSTRMLTIKLPTFSASRSPSVSGTAQVGKTLTAMRGPWTPSPTTTRYQWRLDGRSVSGATSRTWKVPASAKGKRVTVAITGSKTGYATKTLVSPATAAVRAGVFVAPRPGITGTARVGSTLKVVRGTWSPQPTTVRYQWKVGGVALRGATNYLFRVPASARGKRIVVTVTGLRAGYTTRTVASSPTSVIR